MVGYCSSCNRYVELIDGRCPAGHPRSELRDVHEGLLEQAPVVGSARRSEYRDEGGIAAQVLGKGVVIVPVALIVAWGLWSGFQEFGPGMSFWAKLGWSVLSLAMTVGGAFMYTGMHRKH
jgi:hypothetical protein